jgi:hypothetical protein
MLREGEEAFAMNNSLVVAAVAFSMLLPQFHGAKAAGPYDGTWSGTATSTGNRCKRGVVSLTVEGDVVLGQAKLEANAANINGTVDRSGALGATIGFQSLKGHFSSNEFEGTFNIFDCQWEAVLKRTTAGDQTASSGLKGR